MLGRNQDPSQNRDQGQEVVPPDVEGKSPSLFFDIDLAFYIVCTNFVAFFCHFI